MHRCVPTPAAARGGPRRAAASRRGRPDLAEQVPGSRSARPASARSRAARSFYTGAADEAVVPARASRSRSATRRRHDRRRDRLRRGARPARGDRRRAASGALSGSILSRMKVVLPDSSELELPDGATGLDAAAAIGPKLAKEAVLVRSNGDVARPAAAARRRRADPDPDHARQGRPGRPLRPAPLDRAPARRGGAAPVPGREDRDRAADRERLLLRLRVPGADPRGRPREDRGGDRPRAEGGARRGRARRSRADEARARFEAEGEPYKVELVDTAEGDISLYTQGDFTDLCRGPHLQDSKPIKAVKLTGLAGAYWRGDEKNTQLTRIYGTAFYTQDDLDAHLAALEEAQPPRPPPARAAARPLPPLRPLAGLAVLAPEGDGDLERARGPAPPREPEARLRRGEDAAALRHRARTSPRATTRTTASNMFFVRSHDEHEFALKPMNCPGHMLLFGSRLRSYRELPIRFAESSTLHRDELGGTLHGLLRVQARHPGRRAHLLHARADRGRDLRLPRLRRLPLRPVRDERAVRALDAAGEEARHRRGVGLHRGRAAGGARAPRARLRPERGRRRLLRAEDRPAHDRRPRPLVADGRRSSSTRRCRSSSGSPTWAPTTRSTRRTSSTARCSARSSASSGS